MTIRITDVSKSFSAYPALESVSLEIPDVEFGTLLGPSGSGKTTLLRILAGLEQLETGQVWFGAARSRVTSPRRAAPASCSSTMRCSAT